MSTITPELLDWFKKRPAWQQEAARRILTRGGITSDDLQELLILCKKEAGMSIEGAESLVAQSIPENAFVSGESSLYIRLNSIAEVKGANALAPRKPLDFGTGQLAIVYGQNASGKSGYVRLLKHACGARNPGQLLGNVFDDPTKEQGCKFSYTVGDDDRQIAWTPSIGAHKDLTAIEIYDTECADLYVNEENEVTYEPWILSLFSTIVDVCTKLDLELRNEISYKVSVKPALPDEFYYTESGRWYLNLNYPLEDKEIDFWCSWTGEKEKELSKFQKRLAETNPVEKAIALRKTKKHIVDLLTKLQGIYGQLEQGGCLTYLEARKDAKAKRAAADIAAKTLFENGPLEGVGSDTWKLLWEQARAYSEKKAYKDVTFPNTGDKARCLLCQQQLSDEAKQRFVSFETFVKGTSESQAVAAEKRVQSLKGDFVDSLTEEDIGTKLDLTGVIENADRDDIRMFNIQLEKRKLSLMNAEKEEQIASLPNKEIMTQLINKAESLEKDAKAFDEDAKTENRDQLKRHVKELETQKWLSQQRASIKGELTRLKVTKELEEARKLTNTKGLSDKKSALADALITAAYKNRFQKELNSLKASRVPVELIKTQTTKGQVWHQIRLKGAKNHVKLGEVLSEGEFRIVSIAAFLADVEGRGDTAPFVFDDPISSLDQDFEEAAVTRLVQLAKKRQVIVFTHRLSMLALLEEEAKKTRLTHTCACFELNLGA